MRIRLPALLVLLGVAACAPDPALRHAEQTTRVAERALLQTRNMAGAGGEHVSGELAQALDGAERRLSDAEQTVQLWRQSGAGRLGWETFAPCLAAALEDVEASLEASGRTPSAELRQARTMAEAASERTCGR